MVLGTDDLQSNECSAVNSLGGETRESIGTEPLWLAMANQSASMTCTRPPLPVPSIRLSRMPDSS